MSTGKYITLPREWMRPESRSTVVNYIRSLDLPDGWKRAAFLQWLLQTGSPYRPGDLDQVIPVGRCAAPVAEELR